LSFTAQVAVSVASRFSGSVVEPECVPKKTKMNLISFPTKYTDSPRHGATQVIAVSSDSGSARFAAALTMLPNGFGAA